MPIYVPWDKITVTHHGGMWGPSPKKGKSETKISISTLSELFKMG